MMKSTKNTKEDFKEVDVLQAVLLADSFDVKFSPLTSETPRCLMPLANISLIEYALQILQISGIQDVIIYCCFKANKIKAYFQDSKWLRNSAMSIKIIISEDAICLGDALRDLENKGLIRTDFLLLHADTVSNVKFQNILDAHKKRRLASKNNILTLVFMECPPEHNSRKSCSEDVILAFNEETGRILSYTQVDSNSPSKSKVQLPLESLSMPLVNVRFDLIDCYVAVCSPTVLQLMADNFDYESIFDLVKGLIINEEVMGLIIHAYILENGEYAVRVSEPARYEAVTRDVLNRWTYPCVPDVISATDKYICGRNSIYKARNVIVHPTANLIQSVIVGVNTIILNNTTLQDCTIGKNCNIGSRVVLKSTYIFNNVTIGDDVNITSSFIGNNVQISTGVKIGMRCMIGDDTVILNGTIPEGSQLAAKKIDHSYIELGSNCFLCQVPFTGYQKLCNWKSEKRFTNLNFDASDSFDSDSDGIGGEVLEEEYSNDSKLFYNEVLANLDRALKENISIDNLILEINSAKHAYGIEIHELTTLLSRALLDFALLAGETNSSKYFERYQTQMNFFLPLLKNYVKFNKSQMLVLSSIAEFAASLDVVGKAIIKIVKYLYDEDLLDENVIIYWYTENLKNENPIHKILDKLKEFIEWLNNAEEDDDD